MPGSDERVIYICSSSEREEDRGRGRERDRRSRDVDEEILCCAQDALLKVHARITDEGGASDKDDDEPGQVTARLLVPDNQIGCVIGKGGRIIEQMRKDIGTQIRVLPKESLPACAFSSDELVQVAGDPVLVRKALHAISSRIYENPRRERTQGFPVYQGAPVMGFGHYGGAGAGAGNVWPVSSVLPAKRAPRSDASGDELTVRVLCPTAKIGHMIGKGGNVIRRLREESGAKIKVGEPVSDADESVIEISSFEYVESLASPVIEAALQVQRRLADILTERDESNGIFIIKMLVPSNQIGCLIGKGGQIISEMRRTSRANIRIPPKKELPRSAGESDELVQISGEQPVVEAAFVQVLTRLRNNVLKIQDMGFGNAGMLPMLGVSYQGSAPIASSYGGTHDPGSPGGMYSYSGLGLPDMSNYDRYSTSPRETGLPSSVGRSSKESRRRQR